MVVLQKPSQIPYSEEDGYMLCCASLFSQVVNLLSRREFYQLVIAHGAERYSKGYSFGDDFVAMLFCGTGVAH